MKLKCRCAQCGSTEQCDCSDYQTKVDANKEVNGFWEYIANHPEAPESLIYDV